MFPLVSETAEFFKALPADWCIAGGWALDLFLGRVTRKHLDVDICISTADRAGCVQFFLERGWTVEAKLGRGFAPVASAAEFTQEMPYFFSFAPGADFCPAYINEHGDRKLRYQRDEQISMDYTEVYFLKVESGSVVYEKDNRVRRVLEKAVLQGRGVRYLAPELVFLHKADWPKDKDLEDLQRVWPVLSPEQQDWLADALRTTRSVHPWFDQPPLRSCYNAFDLA